MRFAGATDIGRVRSSNEDSYLACGLPGGLFLGVVADGMGGGEAGGEASRLALEIFQGAIIELISQGADCMFALQGAASRANDGILERSMAEFGYPGMGTTLTAALLDSHVLYLCHVGDSRAYIVNDEDIRQVTQDHSLVGEMVRNGEITENEAMTHPKRNVLTQALGTRPDTPVDIDTVSLESGDIVLLCTDGLSIFVDREEIAETVRSSSDIEAAASSLIDLANTRGGSDNITVLLLAPGGEIR